MKHLLAVMMFFSFVCVDAQEIDSTLFKGTFISTELKFKCVLNLYKDDIPVPGLEMDECYGYLNGNLNGVWVILKVKELTNEKALVRAVSDRGGDAQDVEIRKTQDGISISQQDGTNIKGVSGTKYTKLPKTIELRK